MHTAFALAGFAPALTLRFAGKTRHTSNSWRFELKADDFQDQATLTLKPDVIGSMALALLRDELSKPGFVFIPNIHQFASSDDAAWQFQKDVVEAIYQQTEKRWGIDTVEFSTGDVVIVDRDEGGRVGYRGGKGIGSFHFDGGIDQLVSFLYRSCNLKGGLPMVGDLIHCLSDRQDHDRLDELIHSDPRYVMRAEDILPEAEQPGSKRRGLLGRLFPARKTEHPLQRYHLTVDDPVFDRPDTFPMVIINNRRDNGVMHTGSSVSRIHPDQPWGRVLRQVFIRTDLIPDQKIVLVGPPPNETEKQLLPASLRNRFDHFPNHSREHHIGEEA